MKCQSLRWVAYCFCLLLAVAVTASGLYAQAFPMLETEISLAVAHSEYGTGRLTPVGVHFSGWYPLNRYLRVGGEFGGQFKPLDIRLNNEQVKMRDYQFLIGPELVLRNSSRVTPFVHVLGGYATRHFNIPNGHYYCNYYSWGCTEDEDTLVRDSGFGMAVGGGVDVRVHPVVSIRAFQFDYLRTHLHRNRPDVLLGVIPPLKGWQDSYRFTVGVVFHLGERGVR